MGKYILKRIVVFIPTLLVISMLCFFLSRMVPYEPISLCTNQEGVINNVEIEIEREAQQLNLDKPIFFFSFTSKAYPKNLYKEYCLDKRAAKKNLVSHYGNWPQIEQYFKNVQSFQQTFSNRKDSLAYNQRIKISSTIGKFDRAYKDSDISSFIDTIEKTLGVSTPKELLPSSDQLSSQDSLKTSNKLLKKDQVLIDSFDQLKSSYEKIKKQTQPASLMIPTIHWYGFNNQYYHWISNFFGINDKLGFKKTFPFINWEPDMGISYSTRRSVYDEIKGAMFWTILLNIIALILILILAIPLGVYGAKNKSSRFDRWSGILAFMLFSLPSFWVATLLLNFFSNPEYFYIFPTVGLGDLLGDDPFWDRFWETGAHLILPVFCLVYGRIAFLSRQMRGSILNIGQTDFIRTAKAKGLNSNQVIWKHSFRNALIPIITICAGILPGMIAGSVIIETIFAIPGMGRLMISSILEDNWPIVYAIMMLTTVLTMVGILLADIGYSLADPRISFE